MLKKLDKSLRNTEESGRGGSGVKERKTTSIARFLIGPIAYGSPIRGNSTCPSS